jgi:predicted O-methyltransferase YrrM
MSILKPNDPFPDNVLSVPGAIHRDEMRFLYNVPVFFGEGYYLEVGTFKGRSSILVAAGLMNRGLSGKVVTIDINAGRIERAMGLAKERGVFDRIEYNLGDSKATAPKYTNHKFQFVFIDGWHSYEACKEDFEVWSPKIVEGGGLAFHDSDVCLEVFNGGPKRFLEELEKDHKWVKVDQVLSLSHWRRV